TNEKGKDFYIKYEPNAFGPVVKTFDGRNEDLHANDYENGQVRKQGYMRYLSGNISIPDEFIWYDPKSKKDLLSINVPFNISGTTTVLIMDEGFYEVLNYHSRIRVGFELKRNVQESHVNQAMAELIVVNIVSNYAIFMVLTDLDETANTTFSHNKVHQKCVQGLIEKLQLLSGVINKYLETNYPALYFKMKSLDLGPNVPKPFDVKDHQNRLCVVCPLGRFKGGELVFPELKLVVYIKQGQAIAFCSNLLGGNNEEAESSQIYTSPKLGSQKPKTKIKNNQRSYINLEPAKR
ncbi:12887_t:CDS:2, partial [Gigaspora rosea]